MSLASFLDRAARTPFAWGSWDCSLWLADWLVERGYPDPAGHLRGRYRTALGCARVLTRLGGVEGAISGCAGIAQLAPAKTPQAGDVGVVIGETAKGPAPVGGLCTGRRWATLGKDGLNVAPLTAIMAWRV